MDVIVLCWHGPDWDSDTFYQPMGSSLVGATLDSHKSQQRKGPMHAALWYGPERGWELVKEKK